jgi:thiol-disulfide isomerase/thioredoxin
MKNILITMLLTGLAMNGSAQIGKDKTAPELSLPDMKGEIHPLSGLKGKVVLVDFWASWCVPCRRNNPHLAHLYKKYHDRGLEIYGVSIDDEAASWKEAVKQDHIEWLQVNDNKGWNAPSVIAYDVNAIPASFLLDRQGIVRKIDLEGRKLELEIESLLKEK